MALTIFMIKHMNILPDIQGEIKNMYFQDIRKTSFSHDNKYETTLLLLSNYYMFTTDCKINMFYHGTNIIGIGITGPYDDKMTFVDYIQLKNRVYTEWNKKNKSFIDVSTIFPEV